MADDLNMDTFTLYDLVTDPKESRNLAGEQPEIAQRLRQQLLALNQTVEASFAGTDYPEGKVTPPDPKPMMWVDHPAYQPFLPEWRKRWEYESAARAARTGAANKKE